MLLEKQKKGKAQSVNKNKKKVRNKSFSKTKKNIFDLPEI